MQSLDSNFINKHTLSKPKPRLYALIMVCQHNTNWNSNTLVHKVLEPNKHNSNNKKKNVRHSYDIIIIYMEKYKEENKERQR